MLRMCLGPNATTSAVPRAFKDFLPGDLCIASLIKAFLSFYPCSVSIMQSFLSFYLGNSPLYGMDYEAILMPPRFGDLHMAGYVTAFVLPFLATQFCISSQVLPPIL